MIRNRVNPLAVTSLALGMAVAATLSASAAEGLARTDVKIEVGAGSPLRASAAAHPVKLTLGSLAPAQAAEVHPYAATPDTNDVHSMSVFSGKTGR
jgi:hypothetical protein